MPKYTIQDLTVNICTVDRPEYIQAALQSLLDTTPEGASLQIVFNGTPQSTRDVVIAQAKAWRGPTRFIYIEDLLPIEESHNRALDAVETSLVNFMGDDDYVLGPRFDNIISAFNTLDPEPVVISTHARRIAGDVFDPSIGSKRDLGPSSIQGWREWTAKGKVFEMLWPGSVINTASLRNSGGFERAFALSLDNRIFSKLSLLAPVLCLPERNFGFRIHQGSTSTSQWKAQNQTARYVKACHHANIAQRSEPTFEQFLATERAAPTWVRCQILLRDRSRVHFRRGGALMLEGQRALGIANMAVAAALWPPAFIEKVSDQFGKTSGR